MEPTDAVEIRDLSKKYRLFPSTQARLVEALHPFRRSRHKEFWALKDVDFTLAKGATLGILGRNGSGKSTLLQVICSILRPTSGTVRVNGRVAPILDLGVGFNPEFTGRDNVVFHGRLMQLSEAEIKVRLPRVQEFADIGEFFDQPVKTYSSGMFVRLAFASAMNVDPDILVIDEALAVGDPKFQRKCFQRFEDFQATGKTIILVTHSRDMVVRHCSTAILLEGGHLVARGDPKTVSDRYHELLFATGIPKAPAAVHSPAAVVPGPDAAASDLDRFLRSRPAGDCCPLRRDYNKTEHRMGAGGARILDCLLEQDGRVDPPGLHAGRRLDIYCKVRYDRDVEWPTFGIQLRTVDGMLVYGTSTLLEGMRLARAAAGTFRVFKVSFSLALPACSLFLGLGVGDRKGEATQILDTRLDLLHLEIFNPRVVSGLADLGSTFQDLNPDGDGSRKEAASVFTEAT